MHVQIGPADDPSAPTGLAREVVCHELRRRLGSLITCSSSGAPAVTVRFSPGPWRSRWRRSGAVVVASPPPLPVEALAADVLDDSRRSRRLGVLRRLGIVSGNAWSFADDRSGDADVVLDPADPPIGVLPADVYIAMLGATRSTTSSGPLRAAAGADDAARAILAGWFDALAADVAAAVDAAPLRPMVGDPVDEAVVAPDAAIETTHPVRIDRELTAGAADAVAVPAHDPPSVSIIMVTYGVGEIVERAIRSLTLSTTRPFELIVVDNAAPAGRPDTAELLRRRTTGVHLITVGANLGFAVGNEVGVSVARGQYLCFLNPDVLVGPGWLEPLVVALDDPQVAIAAPVLRNVDGTLQEAGQVLCDDACTLAVGGPEVFPADEAQLFARDVDYASAACWLVRRDDHVALGGFDPAYFPAYFEDVDAALRVEARGKRTRLVVDVPVVHARGHGGSEGSLEYGVRSQLVFRSRWGDRISRQPPRPPDLAAMLALRDRLATERVLVIVDDDVTADDCRRVASDAAGLADSRPRWRVTIAIATDAALDDPAGLRRRGLEIATGLSAEVLAVRARLATRVVLVRPGTVTLPPDVTATVVAPDVAIGEMIQRMAGPA